MSIRMAAPWPTPQVVSFFPNPEFGDNERQTSEVTIIRSITNTVSTIIKSKGGRKRLQLRFDNLTRMKALELREFILTYFASQIQLTDVEGVDWVGNFVTNPFEFETTGRRGDASEGGSEVQTLTIDFEGIRQS